MNFVVPLSILSVGILAFLFIKSRKDEKVVVDEDGNEVRSGLGGWLILVGFQLFFSPLYILTATVALTMFRFKNDVYEILTTPGTETYTSYSAALFWGAICVNGVIFVAGVYLVYLYFSKKILFPKFFIWVVVGTLVALLLSGVSGKILFPNSMFDPDTLKEVGRSAVSALIWVPYMMLSKRVKATFVN